MAGKRSSRDLAKSLIRRGESMSEDSLEDRLAQKAREWLGGSLAQDKAVAQDGITTGESPRTAQGTKPWYRRWQSYVKAGFIAGVIADVIAMEFVIPNLADSNPAAVAASANKNAAGEKQPTVTTEPHPSSSAAAPDLTSYLTTVWPGYSEHFDSYFPPTCLHGLPMQVIVPNQERSERTRAIVDDIAGFYKDPAALSTERIIVDKAYLDSFAVGSPCSPTIEHVLSIHLDTVEKMKALPINYDFKEGTKREISSRYLTFADSSPYSFYLVQMARAGPAAFINIGCTAYRETSKNWFSFNGGEIAASASNLKQLLMKMLGSRGIMDEKRRRWEDHIAAKIDLFERVSKSGYASRNYEVLFSWPSDELKLLLTYLDPFGSERLLMDSISDIDGKRVPIFEK